MQTPGRRAPAFALRRYSGGRLLPGAPAASGGPAASDRSPASAAVRAIAPSAGPPSAALRPEIRAPPPNRKGQSGEPGQSPETSFAIATSRETVIGPAASRNSARDACSPWCFTAASSV